MPENICLLGDDFEHWSLALLVVRVVAAGRLFFCVASSYSSRVNRRHTVAILWQFWLETPPCAPPAVWRGLPRDSRWDSMSDDLGLILHFVSRWVILEPPSLDVGLDRLTHGYSYTHCYVSTRYQLTRDVSSLTKEHDPVYLYGKACAHKHTYSTCT